MLRNANAAMVVSLVMGFGLAGCGGDRPIDPTKQENNPTLGSDECARPSCWAAFQAISVQCPPTGTCTKQSTVVGPNGFGDNICFANGVKVKETVAIQADQGRTTLLVTKLDGTTPCWSLESTTSGAVTDAPIVYRDSNGTIMLTAITSSLNMTTTITCPNGDAKVLASSCNTTDTATNPMMLAAGQCTEGMCS